MKLIYVKHPELGNKHVDESLYPTLQKQGWVKWPRTSEQKSDIDIKIPVLAEIKTEEKRKPGRPKKV